MMWDLSRNMFSATLDQSKGEQLAGILKSDHESILRKNEKDNKKQLEMVINTPPSIVYENNIVSNEELRDLNEELIPTDASQLIIPKDNGFCEGKQFIAFLCDRKHMCGGIGDREKGIVSTFLLALLTNRTFVIFHEYPCHLSKFLAPNKYDWTRCYDYVSALPESETEDHKFTGRYKFRDAIPHTNFDEAFQNKVIFLRTNQVWIEQIMLHPNAAKAIPWAVGKSMPEIFKETLDILLRPTDILDDGIKTFLENYSKSRRLICSHIRVGKSATLPLDNVRRFGTPDVNAIFTFLKQFDNSSNNTIYVACDSEAVRASVQGNFTNGVTVDFPVVHIDAGRHVKGTQKEVLCTGLYTALLEQRILSNCDTMLVTYSVMGILSTYMSTKAQDIHIYYHGNHSIFPVKYTELHNYFVNIK